MEFSFCFRIWWAVFLFAVLPIKMYAESLDSLHIAVLGDSNTWLGGDDCSQPRGWTAAFVRALHPASCRSYARSGATWTHTSATSCRPKAYTERLADDNVIFNQMVRMADTCRIGKQPLPDVILIAAGTNDAWFVKARPQIFARSVEEVAEIPDTVLSRREITSLCSLAEAIRFDCLWLMHKFPKAQLVLLTPMQSTAIPLQRLRAVADVIAQTAQALSLCVIRMDRESCVSAAREHKRLTFTTDGTHTTAEGARRNGCYVARKLTEILQW